MLYSQSEVSYTVISELHKQIISYQITVSDVIDQLLAFCNLNLCHTRMIILYRYKKYISTSLFLIAIDTQWYKYQQLEVGENIWLAESTDTAVEEPVSHHHLMMIYPLLPDVHQHMFGKYCNDFQDFLTCHLTSYRWSKRKYSFLW